MRHFHVAKCVKWVTITRLVSSEWLKWCCDISLGWKRSPCCPSSRPMYGSHLTLRFDKSAINWNLCTVKWSLANCNKSNYYHATELKLHLDNDIGSGRCVVNKTQPFTEWYLRCHFACIVFHVWINFPVSRSLSEKLQWVEPGGKQQKWREKKSSSSTREWMAPGRSFACSLALSFALAQPFCHNSSRLMEFSVRWG